MPSDQTTAISAMPSWNGEKTQNVLNTSSMYSGNFFIIAPQSTDISFQSPNNGFCFFVASAAFPGSTFRVKLLWSLDKEPEKESWKGGPRGRPMVAALLLLIFGAA